MGFVGPQIKRLRALSFVKIIKAATQHKRRPKRGSWMMPLYQITLSLSLSFFFTRFLSDAYTHVWCVVRMCMCAFLAGIFPFFWFLFVLTIYWT